MSRGISLLWGLGCCLVVVKYIWYVVLGNLVLRQFLFGISITSHLQGDDQMTMPPQLFWDGSGTSSSVSSLATKATIGMTPSWNKLYSTTATEPIQRINEGATNTNEGNWHTCRYKNQTFHMPHFPAFIIGGAQKAGTTTLEYYLQRHPQLVKNIHPPGENHFFDLNIPKFDYASSLGLSQEERWCYIRQAYFQTFPTEKLIPPTKEAAVFQSRTRNIPLPTLAFEKTPSYLLVETTPMYLKRTCPWIPKVIFILRNPVDRAYSHYKMTVMTEYLSHTENEHDTSSMKNGTLNSPTPPSFEEWIRREVAAMKKWNMTTAPLLDVGDGNDSGNTDDEERRTVHALPDFTHPIHPMYWTTKQQQESSSTNKLLSTRSTSSTSLRRKKSRQGDISSNRNSNSNSNISHRITQNKGSLLSRHRHVGQHIRRGMYIYQLERWYEDYPPSSILVLNYNDMERNFTSIYEQILAFGCGRECIPSDSDQTYDSESNTDRRSESRREEERKNVLGAERKRQSVTTTTTNVTTTSTSTTGATINTTTIVFPPMKESTRNYLQAFFAPYNARLYELLGGTWKDIWIA